MGVLIALALVPTVWTSLDRAVGGLFLGSLASIHAEQWFWVELINLYVPAAFRVFLVIALVGWIMASFKPRWHAWRLPLAFVVLSGTLGPGALVNMGFKDNWQRARPYQVQEFGGTQLFTRAGVITDQCNNNCSFVSGHVACGFFMATLMLVQPRRRRLWAVVGVVSGLAIGFSRIAAGDHWLSDTLWAGPITLLCSWVVWRVLLPTFKSPATRMPP